MRSLSAIAALLISVFVLIAGNGLLSTLVPLRAKLEGFPQIAIGLIGSLYFAGMLAGTMASPLIARRAGYIRAFSALVSLGIVIALCLPLAVRPVPWILMRACLGFAFAGLYAVIEAWVAAKSTNQNRGRIYALYQVANFTGSASGQQGLTFTDPSGPVAFSLTAILFALSIFPLAFTSTDPPAPPVAIKPRVLWLMRISPVGACAGFCIGAANGAFWSLAPVYGLGLGFTPTDVATFMTCVIAGSALAVYPVGRLSDTYDRRAILVICATLGGLADIALASNPLASHWVLSGLGLLLGATTMTLYTLASAHSNDRTGPGHGVIVASGLLFLYCLGAIVAPPIASAFMSRAGPTALFWMNAVVHVSLAAFTLWRMILREAAVPLPRATPTAKVPGVS